MNTDSPSERVDRPSRAFVLALAILSAAAWLAAGPTAPGSGTSRPVTSDSHETSAISTLAPAWHWTSDRPVWKLALSPDGGCVGVLTITQNRDGAQSYGLVVLDATNGQERWRATVPPDVTFVEGFAVAPGCDWVAVGPRPSGAAPGVTTAILVLGVDGVRHAIVIDGVAHNLAISHKGDAIAAGLDYPKDDVNVLLLSPEGRRLWGYAHRHTYREPLVAFSEDDGAVIVTRWFGVGVLARDGKPRWGLGEGGRPIEQGAKTLWRGIDASADLQWFAAHDAPMHGPQGGWVGLLRADGTPAWTRGPYWGPEAIIAPDGAFAVIAGAKMRGETSQPERPDGSCLVVDRRGRTTAERKAADIGTLLFVSRDSGWIVTASYAPPSLVLLNRSLQVVTRAPLGEPVWNRAAGLIVGRRVEGDRRMNALDAYRLPPAPAPAGLSR